MNSKKMAAVVLAATMTGVFGMSACASEKNPEASASAETTSASDSSALLLLNDTLRTKLGEAYADSWIEGNKLHVAVTTEAGATIVTGAGAVAKIVTFDGAQLEAALQAVSAWRSKLPAVQGAAIHNIVPDGGTGTLTIFVAADQIDAVAQSAAADKPAGEVPLIIKESAGLATPL